MSATVSVTWLSSTCSPLTEPDWRRMMRLAEAASAGASGM